MKYSNNIWFFDLSKLFKEIFKGLMIKKDCQIGLKSMPDILNQQKLRTFLNGHYSRSTKAVANPQIGDLKTSLKWYPLTEIPAVEKMTYGSSHNGN